MSTPRWRGEYPVGSSPISGRMHEGARCSNCGRPTKPLRKGRCQRCYQFWRRHGQEHPGSLLKCSCGECRICRNRDGARRRYHGLTFTSRAAGRFLPSQLALPTDPATIGYIAGILDGEGCITRSHGCWRVQIAMTDEELIHWLGGFGGRVRERRKQRPHHRPCWRWLLMRQIEVVEFLTAMLPHLRVKRALAAAALAEIAQRDALRFEPRPEVEARLEELLTAGQPWRVDAHAS